jgi:hypothetical protein
MDRTGTDGLRVGAQVRLQVDRTRTGAIVGMIDDGGHGARYQVFHGSSDIREYDREQLVRASWSLDLRGTSPEAMRLVRAGAAEPGWHQSAAQALVQASATSFGRDTMTSDPLVVAWRRRLAEDRPLDDAERFGSAPTMDQAE